jgi:transcriptional regulator GlxA family with amidase domain
VKPLIRQPSEDDAEARRDFGTRLGVEDPAGARTPNSPGQADARLVVMLVYPGVMAMDVYGPLEAFAMANTIARRPLYRLAIAGMSAAPVATSLGVPIAPNVAVDDLKEPIDTILVSGGFGQAEASADARLLDWLKAGKMRARRCGSICTGAFVIAAAGLLDGKRATTHWAMAAELGQRYPTVSVAVDRIFVRDGNVYTSAGVTSGIDLAISLIEEDHGRMLALKVARALVVYLKRPSGQSQFSNLLLAQFANSPPVRQVQEWALENLGADLSIKALAKRAHMGERTFRRTFTEETGETPRDFVERIRFEAARNLFEEAQLSVQAVAVRCGFENVDNLRRTFLRRLGTTPHKYRQRFRSTPD